MIGYLEGKLVWSSQDMVIISVQGLGYEVSYKNNFALSDLGCDIKLFIVHKISEYGQTLFGFASSMEKVIFESLDNIKGIGSKVIFAIMTEKEIKTFSHLQVLTLDDLVKIPGVGKSTAQKFMLGLSNKLKKEIDLEDMQGEIPSNLEKVYENEINVLVEWGINKKSILSYLRDNKEGLSEYNGKLLIQNVLKEFGKR
jgi:Holliday junction DNA helicase RuvA